MKKIFFILILLSLKLIYDYHIISHKKYTNEEFKIKTYISHFDKDKDGIDDETDILENAKKYIAMKPKYKSKYYNSGYPNDNYGVCTDVVGYALLHTGYDLMKLVFEDINKNKDVYDIKTVDKNIDFRRVKNLNIFFKRNFISLTTDTSQIKEWQGGDIVVFKNHIGIVSNKRNQKGIPFVIHHASPFQIDYEEDILKSFGTIIGHYRVS